MKKIFYLLVAFIGLFFTSCEPMEDIHDEINHELDNSLAVGTRDYTLSDEDYASLDLNFTNFNSTDDARELIPLLLSDLYPTYGEGSSINVTFNLYNPTIVEEYTVGDSDYDAIGLDVDYFAGFAQIEDFLQYQFPSVQEGTFVELTYDVLADEITYTFTNSDFDLIEDALGDTYARPASSAANYNNFDRREGNDAYWSDEMILEAINVVLSEEFADRTGQTYNVSYATYDGSAGTESMSVRYDGNEYVLSGGTAYDVSNEDFDVIEAEFIDDYPNPEEGTRGPAASAGNYNNFDRREGNAAYWSEEMIVEALNFLLHERYPNATDGAKFDVTYRTYDGSAGTELISLVLSEEEYVIDEEASVSTVVETTAYSFINNTWRLPVTLQPEDYTAMGQRYPNFDDQDEAVYKLETFLEIQFPYAEEGDIIPLAYDFYNGTTNTRYRNFQFEDGEFRLVQNVMEQTLQFGHSGTNWEPDNTIRYTLTGPDYAYIAAQFSDVEGYEAPAGNLADYGNFNTGSGATGWDDDMLLEAMRALLNNMHPNAEVGQKYILSFTIYNSGYSTRQMSLIKAEDGTWVLNQ